MWPHAVGAHTQQPAWMHAPWLLAQVVKLILPCWLHCYLNISQISPCYFKFGRVCLERKDVKVSFISCYVSTLFYWWSQSQSRQKSVINMSQGHCSPLGYSCICQNSNVVSSSIGQILISAWEMRMASLYPLVIAVVERYDDPLLMILCMLLPVSQTSPQL